ncbi:MAG: DUF924 family protein, partial [Myxococcales bacterium]|nr:DUF924 family protein [Myxococcales bacterium]
MAMIAIGRPAAASAIPEALLAKELAPRQRLAHDALFFGARFGEPLKTTADVDRVLSFWFGALDADGLADADHTKRWFTKSPEFDETLRTTFGTEHTAVAEGHRSEWLNTPRGRLAWIIVLDQFSRNLSRDSAAMYAHDEAAVHAVLDGLDRGHDRALCTDERVFFYMPLMHSESLTHQDRCVGLFAALHDQVSGAARDRVANNLNYARRHRDIVAKFGRFPHRNALLGRESTAEEVEFLKQPGSAF